MTALQEDLTEALMKKNQFLEVCTDKCKDESDMPCINECGTQYMQATAEKYDKVLDSYARII